MKLLIAGSRVIADHDLGYVDTAVKCGLEEWKYSFAQAGGSWPTLIVCGCAWGIDIYGAMWARKRDIDIAYYPAWRKQQQWAQMYRRGGETVWPTPFDQGKTAGMVRNKLMANVADAAVIVWDGKSRGTRNMIELVAGVLPLYVLDLSDGPRWWETRTWEDAQKAANRFA